MSQPTPPDLEVHVRSTIDPIPANPIRKRMMREELLAHLIGAYEQELEGTDPPRAVAAAKIRFGNLEILREQLRQSVPPIERLIFQFFTTREPLMVRWILVGIACFFIGMGIILPALAQIRDHNEITARAVIPCAIGLAIVLVGIASSIYRVIKISRHRNVTPH